MSNKKRWNVNFGDTTPNSSILASMTQLWVKTDDDTIQRHDGTNWTTLSGGSESVEPIVVSASPAFSLGVAGTSIILNGYNFDETTNIKFVGQDLTEYNSQTVSFMNNTTLSVIHPSLLVNNGPYSIKAVNQNGNSYTTLPFFTVGNLPVWSTPSGNIGGDWTTNNFNSASVVAVDADGHSLTYSVASGSTLPGGVSLNSNTGVISGSLTSTNPTTFNFYINAVDPSGNTSSRLFSIYSLGSIVRQQWTTVGTTTWTSPITTNIRVLVVAGGGSGGPDVGAGGGAGGVIQNNSFAVTSGTSYTVTVGAGGISTGNLTGGGETSNNGNNSVFGSLTAIGGGKGGRYYSATNGSNGGSGGGSQSSDVSSVGLGTAGQGNNGGRLAGGQYQGGGGGGAGAVGGNATSGGGTGGIGIQSNITGVNTYYGGGGGGGGETNLPGEQYISSYGGLGGGGKGFSRNPSITVNSGNFPAIKAAHLDALPNTGGGGGGTGGQTGGGNGGSGFVAIEYSSV